MVGLSRSGSTDVYPKEGNIKDETIEQSHEQLQQRSLLVTNNNSNNNNDNINTSNNNVDDDTREQEVQETQATSTQVRSRGNTSSGGGGLFNRTGSSSSSSGSKRRTSWRHLLTPSYKSRSDEFHKLFCDKIPKSERLIADYSCALHREILIQGRLYISINYIAFYANIFSWITKLVVRLRDISEIYKANTAKIIPNAIQIITNKREKHIFASFVARDKSYIMLLRLWQNNLLNARLSNQEIKNLVHFSYGKDLGMGDNEELKINSPDPATPASVTSMSMDNNNNNNMNGSSNNGCLREKSISRDGKETGNISAASWPGDIRTRKKQHSRYNSIDFNGPKGSSERQSLRQDDMIAEVVFRLNKMAEQDCQRKTSTPSSSSSRNRSGSGLVILDTPEITGSSMGYNSPPLMATTSNDSNDDLDDDDDDNDDNDDDDDDDNDNNDNEHQFERSQLKPVDELESSYDNSVGGKEDELGCSTPTRVPCKDNKLVASCSCGKHEGQLVADEYFDINVDTLFSLVFTNSKFMRACMIRLGMTDYNISKWKRATSDSSIASTTSNEQAQLRHSSSSSSITSELRQLSPASVKDRQVRQLNYSMNVNHMWAKQVHIEEQQNICQVDPGVYVLKSKSANSGVPYAETFTCDLTYCLTRQGDVDKSRMLVHCLVNFKKDKLNWKLSMVKSMIERQTIQGVMNFQRDLAEGIKEYIYKSKRFRSMMAAAAANAASASAPGSGSTKTPSKTPTTTTTSTTTNKFVRSVDQKLMADDLASAHSEGHQKHHQHQQKHQHPHPHPQKHFQEEQEDSEETTKVNSISGQIKEKKKNNNNIINNNNNNNININNNALMIDLIVPACFILILHFTVIIFAIACCKFSL